MIQVALLAVFLLISTVFLHYEGLGAISRNILAHKDPGRPQMLIVVFGVIVLHALEIALYAVGFWTVGVWWHLGGLGGVRAIQSWDYLYFAAEAFPCLGLGDVYPLGDLRLLASVEALNGVILLGWSGSFTFLMMQRFWLAQNGPPPAPSGLNHSHAPELLSV